MFESLHEPIEPRFRLGALVADAPVLAHMRGELRRFGRGVEELAEFVAQIGWNELHPKLPPERIQLFAASSDRFFEPAPAATWDSLPTCPR